MTNDNKFYEVVNTNLGPSEVLVTSGAMYFNRPLFYFILLPVVVVVGFRIFSLKKRIPPILFIFWESKNVNPISKGILAIIFFLPNLIF